MIRKGILGSGKLIGCRLASSKRLVPDPNKVPRTEPIDLTQDSFKKSNTIEDYSVYDQVTPPNNVDSLLQDGFALANGARVVSSAKEPRGIILLGHETFEVDLKDQLQGLDSGRVEFGDGILGILDTVYPKPELVVIGLGNQSRILGPKTAAFLRSRGMQAEVGNTQHGASHFDLLATERGTVVGGILLPPNM